MKILGWGLAIIFAALFTLSSLEKEEEELDYVMDSMSFLIRWNSDQSYAMSCNEESENKQGDNAVSVGQIQKLVNKGLTACLLDGRVGVPLGVGKALAETAYVPIRAAIPYEMAKTALQSDTPKRCSDYIKPLIAACPGLLKPYFERVEFITTEE